jgi:hypothetical protein
MTMTTTAIKTVDIALVLPRLVEEILINGRDTDAVIYTLVPLLSTRKNSPKIES